jgi:glycosyltransferase involved in cell wall biosynthesis
VRRAAIGLGYWRAALARERLDLFETFHLPLVRAPDCPTVLTVHDARPVLREVPLLKRLLYGSVIRSALRRADHVVTVSDTMRSEILAIEPAASVATIYNGIDPDLFDAVERAESEACRTHLALPESFLLAVGHLEQRKNYARLVEALARLRDGGSPQSLVIVGNDGGNGGAIRAAVERNGLSEHVRILSGVSDAELAALYELSRLVVFPSYYEGFGIPILEAMAAHRPLVVSDIPVFRELTEGKGAYFPPHDAAAMAATLADVLGDRERQAALVAYGERRVLDFTFERLADQVAGVHRAILARNPGAQPAPALA